MDQASGHGWAATAGGSPEPDWAALAEQHEQEGRRRKQRQVIGAVVGATLVIGGITATAVGVAGKDVAGKDSGKNSAAPAQPGPGPAAGSDPSLAHGFTASTSATPDATASTGAAPSATASSATSAGPGSAAPSPSSGPAAPPGTRPDPLTVISAAGTDTAPLDPAGLFPDQTLSVGGRSWKRITTATTVPCWKGTTGGLGDVLAAQGCQSLLRATYAYGNSAVTVGVAVFDHRARADAVQSAYKGQVQGLVTAGSISFCTSAGCAGTHGAIGRYLYLTVAGTLKPGGTTADPTATTAAPAFGTTARDHLLARGR
ncbi:hypothetical protein ABT095_07535 [Kitasatospora sp. NPDC002227]|uniref:hypothetical protein n=1 Tax=Kitasatospora sp. NPDC002227 TaxID=3154773 RepID=UPI0033258DF9